MPVVPDIGTLSTSLVNSDKKPPFISYASLGSSSREWSLVKEALRESIQLHPNALQDGKCLVDFYICDPKDRLYNAINQRYWLMIWA